MRAYVTALVAYLSHHICTPHLLSNRILFHACNTSPWRDWYIPEMLVAQGQPVMWSLTPACALTGPWAVRDCAREELYYH